MDRPFTVGTLLSRTFSVWARNLPAIAVMTLVVFSPLLAWSLFAPASAGAVQWGRNALSSLLGFVLTGAVTYLVLQQLRGERARLAPALGAAAERFFAIFATSFWGGLATGVAFLLLVVPGLVVQTMLFVAVPVTVVERPGAFASLERSAALTKGYRWHLFGAAVVLWLLVWGAAFGAGLVIAQTTGVPEASLAVELAGAFAGSIASVASAVAYHDLRVTKEGVDSADLVKVFA